MVIEYRQGWATLLLLAYENLPLFSIGYSPPLLPFLLAFSRLSSPLIPYRLIFARIFKGRRHLVALPQRLFQLHVP